MRPLVFRSFQNTSGRHPDMGSALFCSEGFTVGALSHRGVLLVRADVYFIQRTVAFAAAVILTLMHRTADRPVCSLVLHFHSLLCFQIDFIMCGSE